MRPVRELPWLQHAACRGMDQTIFFRELGQNTRQAKAICASCPVRPECLDYALETHCKYGVFGGLAPTERRGLHRPQISATALCGTDAGYHRHRRTTLTPPCPACTWAHTESERARNARKRSA